MSAVIKGIGNVFDHTPSSDVSGGTVIKVGNLLGIAIRPVLANEKGAFGSSGLLSVTRETDVEFTAGDIVYFNLTTQEATDDDTKEPLGFYVEDNIESPTDFIIVLMPPTSITVVVDEGGGGGDLLAANNLDDLDDIPTALTNLGKDSTGGFAGLTLFKINFKNALNTITSFFTNANTVARTYLFQDRDGTIADDTDLALKASLTGVETLTNKRITKRAGTTAAPSATPSINTDLYDYFSFTGITNAITSLTTGLTGTPVEGDELIISFADNGTSRAITWGVSFANGLVVLPTYTIASVSLYVRLIRRGGIWSCVSTNRASFTGNLGVGTDYWGTFHSRSLGVYGSTTSALKLMTAVSGISDADGFEIATDGIDGTIINREVGDIVLYTASTERLRVVNSTGAVKPTGLLDLSASGAGQIKFPATQNASADANTLDDYEEGDWTPNINFEGGITGMTHSSQVGSYTKIGRQMSINGSDVLTAKGSSTGTLKMKNLPVVSRNVTGSTYPCAVKTYSFNAVGMIQAYVANNDTNIVFSQMSTAGAVTFLNETHVKDDSIIQIFATYFT